MTSGSVAPAALASMASKDLASSEMSLQREQIRKDAVKDVSCGRGQSGWTRATRLEQGELTRTTDLLLFLSSPCVVRPRRISAARQVDVAPRQESHLGRGQADE